MSGVRPRRPCIAICFFGIARSLEYTIDTIEANITAPARQIGDVHLFAHFFLNETIDNPRSGESGDAGDEACWLLEACHIRREPSWPARVTDLSNLFRTGPDRHADGYRSLGNLAHQLVSIATVAEMAKAAAPDIVVFARPDLAYHDSLHDTIVRAADAAAAGEDAVFTPDWQTWRGYNDRFAVCTGSGIAAWAGRIDRVADVLEISGGMNGEQLLKHALDASRVKHRQVSQRASRVRIGGDVKDEDFQNSAAWERREARRQRVQRLKRGAKRVLRALGIEVWVRESLSKGSFRPKSAERKYHS